MLSCGIIFITEHKNINFTGFFCGSYPKFYLLLVWCFVSHFCNKLVLMIHHLECVIKGSFLLIYRRYIFSVYKELISSYTNDYIKVLPGKVPYHASLSVQVQRKVLKIHQFKLHVRHTAYIGSLKSLINNISNQWKKCLQYTTY